MNDPLNNEELEDEKEDELDDFGEPPNPGEVEVDHFGRLHH